MPNYPATERHRHTLDLLRENGHVLVAELSKRFSVSQVTVRKDLRQLEEKNLLMRTHGGAVQVDHYAVDRSLEEKSGQHQEEKRRIGQAAADLVVQNDSIVLDAGSTTLQIARHLRQKRDVTVATASMHAALDLLHAPHVEVLMLGGLVRNNSASVVGPHAEQTLSHYSFRKLFLAGDGFDVRYGLTTTNALEAHLNQQMIASSQQTIVVVDSSKFGRRGLCLICGIEEINMVITDTGAPEAAVEYLEEHGVDVMLV